MSWVVRSHVGQGRSSRLSDHDIKHCYMLWSWSNLLCVVRNAKNLHVEVDEEAVACQSPCKRLEQRHQHASTNSLPIMLTHTVIQYTFRVNASKCLRDAVASLVHARLCAALKSQQFTI